MVYLGDSQPKVQGNISTNIAYKGFILTVGFGVRWGAKQFNATLANKTENAHFINNLDRRVLTKSWQEPGDVVPYKKLDVNNTSSNTNVCDAFVQKDNVFQCTNINLTYNFSDDVVKCEFVRYILYFLDKTGERDKLSIFSKSELFS